MGFLLVSLPRPWPLWRQTCTRNIFGLTRAGGGCADAVSVAEARSWAHEGCVCTREWRRAGPGAFCERRQARGAGRTPRTWPNLAASWPFAWIKCSVCRGRGIYPEKRTGWKGGGVGAEWLPMRPLCTRPGNGCRLGHEPCRALMLSRTLASVG
jgi:hypothetical protein